MKIFFLFLLPFMMSCSNTKKLAEASKAGGDTVFDKQGHRGCRGLMPENTIPAMLKALELGVTTLEMDVVITKDKKVILSHDQWFGQEITTKPNGDYIGEREERTYNIYWMTYEQTKTFDVGLKPHPRFPQQQKMKLTKPLLSEVIDAVKKETTARKKPMPFFNIETKSNPLFDGVFQPKPEEFVELLMGVIREHHLEELVMIQSFDFRTLQYLHGHYPAIKTAMLIEEDDKRSFSEQLKALGFTPSVYSPAYQLVNEKLVKNCHRQHMKIIPWTVNDKVTIDQLKKTGVDGIITDYPDLFNE